jgi:hypothetical protein
MTRKGQNDRKKEGMGGAELKNIGVCIIKK